MSIRQGNKVIANVGGGGNAETLVDTLYPIGSCYIGTGATCPLAAIKGTWTLQSSGIVTSVDTNVPVKGNGISLGLTNGTNNFGATGRGGTYHDYELAMYTGTYGSNVGVSNGNSTKPGSYTLGITTDGTKSGIVGTVTRSTLSVNIWERTA